MFPCASSEIGSHLNSGTNEESPNALLRVLIVDDFEPLRNLVRQLLSTAVGVQVAGEAADGLEAVEKAEELQPDLVLLDIELPQQNGIEAAKQIRVVAPDSRIVFLTTHTHHSVVRQALSTGASGYVRKDRAVKELWPAVRAVLQDRQFVSPELF